MNKAPAFQQYAQDWLVGTAHLSLEVQGAYERLLCHQWVDGPLPNDPVRLARMLGVSIARFRRIWVDLAPHFPEREDGLLANPRLEFERDKQAGYRLVQSIKGQASAQARSNRGSTAVQPNGTPKANLSSSSSNPHTDISVESRVEARGRKPQALSELLSETKGGEANRVGDSPILQRLTGREVRP